MSAGSPAAFLQCGDWTYPLVPGCSPVLHSNFGPYMFPDLERPGGRLSGLGGLWTGWSHSAAVTRPLAEVIAHVVSDCKRMWRANPRGRRKYRKLKPSALSLLSMIRHVACLLSYQLCKTLSLQHTKLDHMIPGNARFSTV